MILYVFKNKYYSAVVVTFGQWLFGTDTIKPIFPILPSLYLFFSSCRSFGSQSGESHSSQKQRVQKGETASLEESGECHKYMEPSIWYWCDLQCKDNKNFKSK